MAVWPGTLPQKPLQDGYQEAMRDTVIRTPMDIGPAKQRRRSTSGPRKFMMPLELTGAELAIFDTFYSDTLADGALSFDWVHPRTGAAVSFRCIGGQPPQWRAVGGDLYGAVIAMEILP